MTGDQLKTWRTNRNLSQDQLAAYLGWTRDRVANTETERTTMKENIEAKLGAIDELLVRAPPPNKQRAPKGSKRIYLDTRGRRIPFASLPTAPGTVYYEYGWRQGETGHRYFNLMQVGRDWDGSHKGLCTPISLNADTWQVGAFVQSGDPAIQRTIAALQAALDEAALAAFMNGDAAFWRTVGYHNQAAGSLCNEANTIGLEAALEARDQNPVNGKARTALHRAREAAMAKRDLQFVKSHLAPLAARQDEDAGVAL